MVDADGDASYNDEAPGYAPYGNPDGADTFDGDLVAYGQNAWRQDSGDDIIRGGNEGTGNLYIIGGYGDDKIWSGADRLGNIAIFGDNLAFDAEEDAIHPNLPI